MVSENLARSRIEQGVHGHLGGAAGNCEKAKVMGRRMGGKNNAARKESGSRVPWLDVKANLEIYQD